jgi:hypothetical protein
MKMKERIIKEIDQIIGDGEPVGFFSITYCKIRGIPMPTMTILTDVSEISGDHAAEVYGKMTELSDVLVKIFHPKAKKSV